MKMLIKRSADAHVFRARINPPLRCFEVSCLAHVFFASVFPSEGNTTGAIPAPVARNSARARSPQHRTVNQRTKSAKARTPARTDKLALEPGDAVAESVATSRNHVALRSVGGLGSSDRIQPGKPPLDDIDRK